MTLPIPRPTNPARPKAMARHSAGLTHAEGEAFAMTYVPKAINWVTTTTPEPMERTMVVVIEPMELDDGKGVWTSYTRSTNFAGNLTEALKVMGF